MKFSAIVALIASASAMKIGSEIQKRNIEFELAQAEAELNALDNNSTESYNPIAYLN